MEIIDHNKIKTIGIIGWGLMGDVLMRTPVIHAIRDVFPHAKIVVSTDPVGEEVLRYNTDIDRIFTIDRKKRPKLNYLFNKLKAWKDLRFEQLDIIIDLYNGKSSNTMMRLSGAKYKITFRDILVEPRKNNFHISNELLDIVSLFSNNYQNYGTKPIFTTRSITNEKMKKYVDTLKQEKTYLLNFGSGGLEKILPMEKSFEQVKFLYLKYGFTPLIICNPGQEHFQKTFIEKYLIPCNIPYHALPILSLEEIGAIMRCNDFIITPDTGLYHIAVATDIPILGIFTYTDPRLVEPENGIYIHCFQSEQDIDSAGLRFGNKDLDLEYLLERTKIFMELFNKS